MSYETSSGRPKQGEEESRALPRFISEPDPNIYRSNNFAILDFETTNLGGGHARIKENRFLFGHCVFSSDAKCDRVDFHSLVDLYELAQRLRSVDFIIAHNAKFEIQWMERAGIDTSRLLFYCTMIGEYVIGGNRTGEGVWPVNLNDSLARYNLPGKHAIGNLIKSGFNPEKIEPSLLRTYCRKDVDSTMALFKVQREILIKNGLLPVFFLRCLFSPVVADMEMRGMALDVPLVRQLDAEYVKEVASLRQQLDELTGGINLNSWPQKVDFMYESPDGLKFPLPRKPTGEVMRGAVPKNEKQRARWPQGAPSTDKNALRYLITKATTVRQKTFLKLLSDYQVVNRKRTNYTKKFLESGAIMYGGLNQTVTKTHRLASSPNLQNIDNKLKKCFKARHDGWLVMNADYSQLEFRIAGVLSQDPTILEDIVRDNDPHSYSAHIIFGTPNEDLRALAKIDPKYKDYRNGAKRHTFKPLYGGTKGLPNEVAYYEAFKKKYPLVTRMQQAWCDECIEKGSFVVCTGLRVYFPGTKWNTKGTYIINSGKILNLPVQQFATADISPLGCTLLWHYIRREGLRSFLINTVHDSTMAEVPPEEREIMTHLANKAMTGDMIEAMQKIIGFQINYPIDIDVEFSNHWSVNL